MALNYADILHLSNTLYKGISASSFAHFPKKLIAISHFINSFQYRLTPLYGNPRFHMRLPHKDDFLLCAPAVTHQKRNTP